MRTLINWAKLTWYTLRKDMADLAVQLAGPEVRVETAASAPADPEVVVDLFTGTGSVLIEYARRFPAARLVAVDVDARLLELVAWRLARRGFSNVERLAADARDLPLDDDSADAVNISFGLHESEAPDRDRVLAEAARVLRPGGTLIVSDYREPAGSFNRAVARGYFRVFEPPWISELFGTGLADQVRSAGLELRETRYDLPLTQIITAHKR